VGLVALYLPVLGAIVRVAATDTYAGHVLFVPVVSAIILWRRRDRFRAITGPGDRAGLGLLGVALGLLVLAHTSRSYPAHAVSAVLAIAGVGLWLRGREWLRQAALPLGFLLLILPPPRGLTAAVTPTVQHFVAGFSAGALSLLHIPVERHGLLLHLPSATLSIAEGCNGLRFLLVLVVIMTGVSQIVLSTGGRRLLLVIAAIPAAVLANVIRVTEIAGAVYLLGPQAATGWLHDYIGRGTWLLTIAVLLAGAIVLRKSAPSLRPEALEKTDHCPVEDFRLLDEKRRDRPVAPPGPGWVPDRWSRPLVPGG
jgi:exosortase